MRITRAYCVELEDFVTIDEARRAFLSTDPRPQRYRFLCSSRECMAAGVKVTGVNYTFNPEEDAEQAVAHFRANPAYPHSDDCEWVLMERADLEDTRLPHETNEQAIQRRLRRRLNDLVTGYDPRLLGDRAVALDERRGNEQHIRGEGTQAAGRFHANEPGDYRTRDLQRLVATYLEARDRLTFEQRHGLMLNVTGIGTLRLFDYFRPIRACDTAIRDRVIYGGATLHARYGAGFRLRFIDRINELPVYLYVGSQEISAYRFGRYVRGIVDEAETRKYFTVYALGRLEYGPNRTSMNLVVEDLRHLVLKLGPLR